MGVEAWFFISSMEVCDAGRATVLQHSCRLYSYLLYTIDMDATTYNTRAGVTCSILYTDEVYVFSRGVADCVHWLYE